MSETSQYVTINNINFHFLQMGKGKKLLIAFHGYGNNAFLFSPLQQYLENEFTIVSVDLPFHGKTQVEEGFVWQQSDLVIFISQLMQDFKVEKISLIGYSMGGRICLTVAQLLPEKTEQILLIASDGLVFNPFYYFATKTIVGKCLFANALQSPAKLLGTLKWLDRKKMINNSRYKFFTYYLAEEQQRDFLRKVWNATKELVPDLKKLKRAIDKHQIPVYVFMGEYDKVIPVTKAKKFVSGMKTAQLFILGKGHRVMDSETIPMMAKSILS